MQALRSTEQFEYLVSEAKRELPKLVTNCYLSADEISRYCKLGRIFYEKIDGGVFFYCDEETYYQTYFYFAGERKPLLDGKDRPVVIRLIHKEGKKPPATAQMEQFLLETGFVVRDVTLQICARPREDAKRIEKCLRTSLRFLERHGFKLFEPKEEHLEQILKLRDGVLDPLHFSYMTREEMLQGLQQGHFQCMIDPEGKICGTHTFDIIKGTAYGNIVVVEEKYRNLGIGPMLVYRFLHLSNELNLPSCYGWIINDNFPSIEMHTKIGFRLTGKASTQLVHE